jgi:1-acyl-sn-glycerol-3-phosphate acyltransferase
MFAAIKLLMAWMILGLPAALIGLPWTVIRGDISFLYRWAMWVVRSGLSFAGVRVKVTYRQSLDPGQRYIFLSNHISNLDPPILVPVIPGRVSVFLKRSLLRIPFLGYGMRLANFIPVDRDGSVKSAKESVETAARVLASGVHILSFVEGTRSRDGRLLPFKKGPFYLAMESGAPIVPVSIFGTENMLKKGSVQVTPGTAHVTFHAPLWPRDYATREDLSEAVRRGIESGLPEWMWAARSLE